MKSRVLRFFVVSALAAVVVPRAAAQFQDPKGEIRQIKARQKEESKSLKIKQGYTRQMLKNQELPRPERVRAKHEMQRERREMRQKHKNELQDFKDRQRSLKNQ